MFNALWQNWLTGNIYVINIHMSQVKIDSEILNINDCIEKNIEIDCDFSLKAINILKFLRDLVEHICVKIWSNDTKRELNTIEKDCFESSKLYISSKGQYSFVRTFHSLLQKSTSHYTSDEFEATILFDKYLVYLLKIKQLMKNKYNLEILRNLGKIQKNKNSDEFYLNIYKELNKTYKNNLKIFKCYIENIKPIYIENEVIFQVEFTSLSSVGKKTQKIIAFTKLWVDEMYACQVEISKRTISVGNKILELNVIEKWQIQIRECEIKKMFRIFDYHNYPNVNKNELAMLNFYLTKNQQNITNIIKYEDIFNDFSNYMVNSKSKDIYNMIKFTRDEYIKNNDNYKILIYLFCRMNSRIIDQVISSKKIDKYNLYIKTSVRPFISLPIAFSLPNHNPLITDLSMCFDLSEYTDELLWKSTKCSTIKNRLIFNNVKDEEIDLTKKYVDLFNSKLTWDGAKSSKLCWFKNNIYIESYLQNIIEIKKILEAKNKNILERFSDYINQELNIKYSNISDEKKKILVESFKKSNILILKGAAGTGKSTLIKEICDIFLNNLSIKIFTHTHSALENLKNKIKNSNIHFSTVRKIKKKFRTMWCNNNWWMLNCIWWRFIENYKKYWF